MSKLTVTAKGQVTLRKDLLRHLGVAPGQRIETHKLPGGKLEIRAAGPSASIDDFIGILAGKTDRAATLDEIQEAITEGWAGRS